MSHELTLRESGAPNWLVENRAHMYSSATSDENFSSHKSLRRMQPQQMQNQASKSSLRQKEVASPSGGTIATPLTFTNVF